MSLLEQVMQVLELQMLLLELDVQVQVKVQKKVPCAGPREVPCADPSAGPRAVLSESSRKVPCADKCAGPRAVPSEGPREVPCASPREVSSFTQQSTSRATGQKRKTSTALRGGASLAYKKPRQKQAKTTGYGLLFGSGGSVNESSENIDWVLHSATLTSSTPTNIDLGYKPKGLRWKGRATITQRQLR
uniref:Uncharacterized protein n=1 Tax=Solanum lycopersicum TaxID=4081 RepID=K4D139_SOLLC